MKNLAPLFVEELENRSLNFKGTIQLKKDENIKIEFKPNTRYMKLCLPKDGFQELKSAVETKLDDWISDLLEQE